MRVDVGSDVKRLLTCVGGVKVAQFGAIMVLQPTSDGKERSYVTGACAQAGDRLNAHFSDAGRATLGSYGYKTCPGYFVISRSTRTVHELTRMMHEIH
ncbi:MAG: hypothetical protein EPN62_04050 [Candidimonas sp.]|nr:MAG: hypothetical protein EPN77_15800 [Candidimonas sp.]TAM25505.1 MAG: hypothetical protein EPN62_04050 [Candidimonas sp.]